MIDSLLADQTHVLLLPVYRKSLSSPARGRRVCFCSGAHHLQADLIGTTLIQLRP